MSNKEAKVSIIIPTYNEKENLAKLIKSLSLVFLNYKINGRIIVVDDNSPDSTGDIADNLSKTYPLEVVHRTKNRGYGNSTLDGFRKALSINSDIIITMDCDFSHNPEKIPEMIKALEDNDVAIGSRRVDNGKIVGWNLWRHFCSSGASWFSRLMLGLKTKDITSGFRAYKKEVIESIPLGEIQSNGYSFLEELLFYVEKHKFKIKEIPIVFEDRKYGKSKLSKKEILKFFIAIIRLNLFKNNRFLKFIIVGFFGIIVNSLFLWFFKAIMSMPLVLSGILAIELSVIANFIFNNHWTFRHDGKNSANHIKFIKYHLSVLVGIFINYSILLILTEFFGVFYLVSNLIGIAFATISNYLFSSRWAWR